jgi:hypothetical protein
MKKSLSFIILVLSAFTATAQNETFDPFHDRQLYFDTLNIAGVLAGIYLISSFILKIIQGAFRYRLKNRMLDRGTEENIVRELLQPDKKNNRNDILQWFCIVLSIGVGLTLVSIIRPFGLHSIAIMAFSVAAGFGGYYYFTRVKSENNY